MSDKGSEFPALVIKGEDIETKQVLLDQDMMTLGREDGNDIVVPNRQVSRHHLTFHRKNDYYLVEDMNSKNGTWVNGNRLEGTVRIYDGDRIDLALKVNIIFVGSGITAPVTEDLPNVIVGKRLKIDTDARRVFILNQELDPPLSLPQYRLLELLFINASRVCSRDEVVETVWPEAMGEGVSEQAIDALVRRLRDRIMEIDPEHQYVVTVRGHGFRLDNPS